MALSTIGANQIASLPASSVGSSQLATDAITSAGLPAGTVLQVQYLQYTSTTSTAVANGANQTLDHLTLNITPTATNSIIRLDAMVNGEWNPSTSTYNSVWFFYRGATKLAAPTAGNRLTGVAMSSPINYFASNADSTPEMSNWTYFDTPSTTSQVTYTVATQQNAGQSATWYTNRTVSDQDTAFYERGIAFISATEIAV